MNIFQKNPLFDKQFLNDLFHQNQREVYARITSLTFDEKPIEQIEGKIIDGSVNIDGSSAVRRTCSLNMIAEEVNINSFYWGLSNKFKLEVGLYNSINNNYPDIIWFKQGIFVISQFNTTQSTNKWSIKIQGKDKMCLLNGEFSGQLPPTDFATEQYTDLSTGTITFKQLPIKTIILKLLQEFALEQSHNIIINDIDESGQELLEYRGSEPFYLFKNLESNTFDQMSINKDLECYYRLPAEISYEQYYQIPADYDYLLSIYVKKDNYYVFNQDLANNSNDYLNNSIGEWFKGKISDSMFIVYDNLLDDVEFEGGMIATEICFYDGHFMGPKYNIARLEYGDVSGYRMNDLVYPGELKSSAGETITSVLDKIKNKFTNFEYYYDIDGKFIFQKKPHYITTPWNGEYGDNELFQNAAMNYNDIAFSFTDSKLIVSFQNTPKLQNLKNDYAVHGKRDNIAVRMRYAIDNKPTIYMPIRKLQDKIITLIRDTTQQVISAVDEFKYYDAPEIQPYNTNGLQGINVAYDVLYLLEVRPFQTGKNYYLKKEIDGLKESINPLWCGQDFYNSWFDLFQISETDKTRILWTGTVKDIKDMIQYIVNGESLYDKKADLSIIPFEGGEKWILICPQFAAYPYSVQYVVINKDKEMQLLSNIDNLDEESTLIHYKVDWRELIYQMALDYRQLNTEPNYYYYLKQANPQFIDNKTGYEQYYIDISLWRDLYNPNPKMEFNTQLTNVEVQKHSLLIDNDSNNDALDMIYIQGGYKLAEKSDTETLNYLNTYAFSKPKDSNIKSMYPYYSSDICQLKKTGQKYYLEDDVTKKIKIAFDDKGNAIYDMLAYAAPQKIYIKNDAELAPLAFSVSELKAEYEPFKYYIKNAEGFYELSTEYVDNETYYVLKSLSYVDAEGFDIQTSSGSTDFTVLEHPFTEEFDKVYGTSIATNYAIFADVHFKDTLNKLLEKTTWDNKKIYIKDNNYIKLSKDNPLWNLYYRSDIFPLSYKTTESIHDINNQIKTVTGFLNNPISYLNTLLEIIKKYIIYLESFKYEDIKIALFNTLYSEMENKYIPHMKELSNKTYTADRSCLTRILTIFSEDLDNIEDMITKMNNMQINDKLLYLLTILFNLNRSVQTVLNSIEKNYNQVSFISNNSTLKGYLEGDEDDTKVQYTTLQYIDDELEKMQLTLESTKQEYVDGQSQKTLTVLKNIRKDISTISEIKENTTITDALKNEVEQAYQKIISDTNNMLNDINTLKEILDDESQYVMQLFAWTPNPYNYSSLEVSQEEYNTFIKLDEKKFEWNEEKQKYIYLDNIANLQDLKIEAMQKNNFLYKFLSDMEDLKDVFSCTDINKIIEITTINGYRVLEKFLTPLLNSMDIQQALKEFQEQTSCFQEHIIRENVDNFNYIKDNKLISYEPIIYYKASYNYNRDKELGNFWMKDIFDNPQTLTFWFDFLEPTSLEMSKCAVPAIGIRSTVVNDKDVKTVTYKDIPPIIFTTVKDDYDRLSGYTYINLTNAFSNLFAISSKGKTAKERIDELLYQHSYCSENINISTIPIYNLEPNQTIYVRDDKSNINGEYIVSKITVPLNYKKTMSITATKSVNDII